jgi:hypothetical protein
MKYESFWHLHDLLEAEINEAAAKIRGYSQSNAHRENWSAPPVPNSAISTIVRLGIKLRYFAGGLPYDIMVKFGISHSPIFDCVWIVVEAINSVSVTKKEYPSDVEEQKKIARGFAMQAM